MIPISKIDDKYGIYKENQVILWGAGFWGKKLLRILRARDISVTAFCDNDETKWGSTVMGVSVISPKELEALAKTSSVVVQLSIADKWAKEVLAQVTAMGITSTILREEAYSILAFISKLQYCKENPQRCGGWGNIEGIHKESLKIEASEFYMEQLDQSAVYICMFGKTGDNTLKGTFHGNGIPFFMTEHHTDVFDLTLLEQGKQKVKIITAVREPISLCLSALYQLISHIHRDHQFVNEHILKLETPFMEHGGDAQLFFDLRYETTMFPEVFYKRVRTMDLWFKELEQSLGMSLFSQPFDQEKGYTIVKKGNIEVFIYQLEKLTGLVTEIADFVGGDFDHFDNGNEAQNKWIAQSYEVAKKELTFSQAFFDQNFEQSYLSHCYSEADILKFKEKWAKNIDPKK